MSGKKSWNIDSLVLIFSFILVAQLLSYIVPHGEFDRKPYPENPKRSMVIENSFKEVAPEKHKTLQAWHFLTAIPKGLEGAQDIIFLVFLVGGVIAILRKTGAIDAALQSAVNSFGHSPWVLIAGCLFIFSIGSFTVGMGEEYLPLIPIIVTMCLAMRMDAVVALGMVWIPCSIGWATAGTNPFGVIIAQNIAGVPIMSGAGLRLVMMFAFLALGFHHLYKYAKKIKGDPGSSLVADIDYSQGFEASTDTSLTKSRISVLLIFAIGIISFVFGAKNYGWYINELNAVFLAIGILAAIVTRMSAGETSQTFLRGASEMTAAALIIGFARAIEVVLTDGQIIDTVVNGIANLLEGLPAEISAIGMLGVQTVCNFFIPSGSGQAFVTMPIMAPLAQLTGVPAQTAVLAYQFGDGFTNMIIPTNALVIGALALGKVPYSAWVKFLWPLMVKIFLLAIAFLVLSTKLDGRFGF